jgi:hypothetical protein
MKVRASLTTHQEHLFGCGNALLPYLHDALLYGIAVGNLEAW